jgi:hypothetical protein
MNSPPSTATTLKRVGFIIGAPVLFFWTAVFLWELGWYLCYRWQLNQALDGPIAYVEFQANTDWPKQHVTDPEKISAVKAWLLATEGCSMLRSAPPQCVCEMRFVFEDGQVVAIHHSPFREPLSSQGWGLRDDIRVCFRRHLRSGSPEMLAEILDPP